MDVNDRLNIAADTIIDAVDTMQALSKLVSNDNLSQAYELMLDFNTRTVQRRKEVEAND